MTVSSTISKSGPFACDGSTVNFAFGIQIFGEDDIQVVQTDSSGVDHVLTLGTDYSVLVNGDQEGAPGGSINTVAMWAIGNQITVLRNLAATQGADIENLGGFYPKVIENALDKLTMLIQELMEQMSRVLFLSPGAVDPGSEDAFLASVESAEAATAASASAAAGSATAAAGSAAAAAGSAGAAAGSAASLIGALAGYALKNGNSANTFAVADAESNDEAVSLGQMNEAIASLSSGGSGVGSSGLTLQSAQTLSAGTSVNFAGIPSSAKRLQIMLDGATVHQPSASGDSQIALQLNAAATGYHGLAVYTDTTADQSTTAFPLRSLPNPLLNFNAVLTGVLTLCRLTANEWCLAGNLRVGTADMITVAGSVTLSGALSTLSIITTTGSLVFTAGNVSINYE